MVRNNRLEYNLGIERRLMKHLLDLDYSGWAADTISSKLNAHGFTNTHGQSYTSRQISSILHSVNVYKRAQNYPVTYRCGIDRQKNPCGDASEY